MVTLLFRAGVLSIEETGVLESTLEEDATNVHFDNNISLKVVIETTSCNSGRSGGSV